jgi:hypothetical protein
MPAFLQRDEAEVADCVPQRLLHALGRMWVVVTMDGQDRAPDLLCQRYQSAFAPEPLGLRPRVLVTVLPDCIT